MPPNKKSVLGIDSNVLLGVVYVPPEEYKYFNLDLYDEFVSEITTFTDQFTYICMTGDFNGRTNTKPDCIQVDTDIIDILDFDDETTSFFEEVKTLSTFGVNSKRFNQDVKPVNRNGERLLDLCCNHTLFIVNGRFGADANFGKTTCKDISVVDYTIVSADVFSVMHTFHIADFNPIISDIH